MAITKRYETENECAHLFFDMFMQCFDSSLITYDYPIEWMDHWTFMASETSYDDMYDEEELEEARENEELFRVNVPMWYTWFEITDSWLLDKIQRNAYEVSSLGFTLIYHNNELWGLGIDGAGYDFYEHHWIPLYRWLEFTWHEED